MVLWSGGARAHGGASTKRYRVDDGGKKIPRCDVCYKPWHTQAECFAPGGGLARLSADERRAWIEAKQKCRNKTTRFGSPAQGSASTGEAKLAESATQSSSAAEVEALDSKNTRMKDILSNIGFEMP